MQFLIIYNLFSIVTVFYPVEQFVGMSFPAFNLPVDIAGPSLGLSYVLFPFFFRLGISLFRKASLSTPRSSLRFQSHGIRIRRMVLRMRQRIRKYLATIRRKSSFSLP